MIMFRKKVDPQTVVTIQNSLPRIVIALILITFSYPIAALIFNLSTPLSDFVKAQFFPDLNFATMTGAILASLLLILVGILVGVALSTVVGSPILGIAVAVLFVVLGFALIFAYIYIGWTWLTRIGKLIFLTLAAPFILLVGALPGNEKSIFNWVKSLLSLALQLPAIWFVMYLGVKILSYYYAHPIAAALHGAPIVGFLTAPIIAIWILYQVGKVPKLVDEALGVELMFGGSGGGKKK